MSRAATHFFRGLLILLPLAATFYVIQWVFTTLDEMVFSVVGGWLQERIPNQKPDDDALGRPLRTVIGMAATIVLITGVGMLAGNIIGGRIVALLERLVDRVPLVKMLHGAVRDVLGAFVGDKRSFDKPVAVSLSEDGATKVVGFVTRDDLTFLGVPGHVAVYLPQSYNFAGNLLLVPRERVTALETPSGDVMTFLVSGGVSGKD